MSNASEIPEGAGDRLTWAVGPVSALVVISASLCPDTLVSEVLSDELLEKLFGLKLGLWCGSSSAPLGSVGASLDSPMDSSAARRSGPVLLESVAVSIAFAEGLICKEKALGAMLGGASNLYGVYLGRGRSAERPSRNGGGDRGGGARGGVAAQFAFEFSTRGRMSSMAAGCCLLLLFPLVRRLETRSRSLTLSRQPQEERTQRFLRRVL